MLSIRLIKLIENQAEFLTREVVEDLLTNENTPAFHRIPKAELEPRVLAFYQNLGNWIGDPKVDAVRAEYEEWGRIRSRQGIPVSEIVYSLILTKRHLRRYIREHAFVVFSGDRVTPDELIPYELYNVQELNYTVGDFFDNALYYLTRGSETQAKAKQSAA
jgi:hypothetical protein